MASSGWNPKTLEEVVAQLGSESMRIALQVKKTRTCPAPPWDTDHPYYRVALAGGAPQIQRSKDGATWERAPLKKPSAPEIPAASAASKELVTETRSILFMDLAGWSKLEHVQIADYFEKALPRLDELVKHRKAQHVNTWGDALVATFSSAKDAAECALDIRDFFGRTSDAGGVPKGLVPRVALHLGEVFVVHNPVLGRADIFGEAVHLAARLEPVTLNGEVYCTAQFAKALESIKGFGASAHRLGDVVLPKDFGTVEVFAVTGPNQPAPALPVQATAPVTVATPLEPPLGDEETIGLLGSMFRKLPQESTSLTYEEIIARTHRRVSRDVVKRVIEKAAPKGENWGWTVTVVGEETVTLTYQAPSSAFVIDARSRRIW